MQQQIRFCSTADGVRIAYATVGAGPAMMVAELRFSHLGLDWEEPRVREFWETIGQHHMVVRYDTHGCGLSDRNRSDFSLDSEIRPIEAIVKEAAEHHERHDHGKHLGWYKHHKYHGDEDDQGQDD
jgi:hypothetical protein